MSEWSLWSDCSTSCGTGAQYRFRNITQLPTQGGRQCPDLDNDHKVLQLVQHFQSKYVEKNIVETSMLFIIIIIIIIFLN